MATIEDYKKAFKETFMVDDDQLAGLSYQDIPEWDSVGHMALMASLEEVLGIELDIDDIIDFSSYEYGQEILKKYDVKLS